MSNEMPVSVQRDVPIRGTAVIAETPIRGTQLA